MKALNLDTQTVTRENLLTLAKKTPGAWTGIKIAALLLVLNGQRPGQVNNLFGLSRMTLNRWIHEANQDGIRALIPDPRPGRTTQLTPSLSQNLKIHLEKSPREFGLPRSAWDGPTLVVHLKKHFGVNLKARQAQYWIHQLGYSLKRAGYVYLQARSKDAQEFREKLKKTSSTET
jgi:transposase